MSGIGKWAKDLGAVWNQFWFDPQPPQTLALIRILGGAMLFYTHLVWSFDLQNFLGRDSWITADVSRVLHGDGFVWSYLWYIDSPWLLWASHLAVLSVFMLLTVGLWTPVVSALSCFFTLSYCHRLNGALFGLDQVNAMLATYLMVGASGDCYSIDAWLRRRHRRAASNRAGEGPKETSGSKGGVFQRSSEPLGNAGQGRVGEWQAEFQPKIRTNIAVRLIQVHLCVIYLFGGIGKMRGEMWWDGSALWYALSNYEYQSMNVLWLGRWPIVLSAITHVTVFWETFYWALVAHRLTRPIALALAIVVHGGIACAMGMITFGTAMIIANGAFVSPQTTDRIVRKLVGRPVH